MHKYRSPIPDKAGSDTGDQRKVSRRLFDSLRAKFVRVLSIVLGVYAPLGILFGVLVMFMPLTGANIDEDEFKDRRMQFGLTAIGIVASGIASGYVSYRSWEMAANVRRNNRCRAKGLE
ncbi:MAG: hypothetical protein HQ477_12915 [Chloroflexi bacterium]|nr:hypothetical protein [Chloroflexota bacterium]